MNTKSNFRREILDHLDQTNARIRAERLIIQCESCLSCQHLKCRLASALRHRERIEHYLTTL
jgi:hypothetical protein